MVSGSSSLRPEGLSELDLHDPVDRLIAVVTVRRSLTPAERSIPFVTAAVASGHAEVE
jgi:hypothetical protein